MERFAKDTLNACLLPFTVCFSTHTFTPVTDAYRNPRICSVEAHQNANTIERVTLRINHHLSIQISLQYLPRRTVSK